MSATANATTATTPKSMAESDAAPGAFDIAADGESAIAHYNAVLGEESETSRCAQKHAGWVDGLVVSRLHLTCNASSGELVALDSEYVSVESATGSVRRDGSRVTTALGRQSLARLSCVPPRLLPSPHRRNLCRC